MMSSAVQNINDVPKQTPFDFTYASLDKSLVFAMGDTEAYSLMYQIMPAMTSIVLTVTKSREM